MNGNDFSLTDKTGTTIDQMSPLNYNPVTPTFHLLSTSSGRMSPADAAFNQPTTATQSGDSFSWYYDRDGVVRKGDPNPASPQHHDVDSPYTLPNLTSSLSGVDARPVMLNRPFRSVAEMGYAFRDEPFRTLNFSSADSADGGLLDLFCLNEYNLPIPNRAGVVNLNSASQNALVALLSGEARDPGLVPAADGSPLPVLDDTSSAISHAGATTIAKGIRAMLGPNSPPTMVIQNTADLPKLIDKLANGTSSVSPKLDSFKFKREAIARALGDVSTTRTWNLMIDIVGQAGRFSPNAKTLDNFNVEGERRYWVHVSIDRYTGRVIDAQTETVFE